MKGIFELLIIVVVIAIIYQMFFSKKKYKEYDPREYKQPDHSKGNIISKPKDGYTPDPPMGESRPYAESLPDKDLLQEKDKLDKDRVIFGHHLSNGEEFFILDKEMNLMTLVVGATGAGKTVAMKTLLELPFKNNDPIVVIDGKGDVDFAEDLKIISKKYNRNFKLFSMDSTVESMHYNCLRHGGFTELKDKIINIFDWSEEHYKLQAERLLQGAFKLLLLPETKELIQKNVIDLSDLSSALNLNSLATIAQQIGEPGKFMIRILNEVEESAGKGLANRIKSITESELAHLFVDTLDPMTIDLLESIENNDVVVFSIDALKFPEYAKMIGRLVIADLKTVSPKFAGQNKRIYTVFDEFNVFASEIIVNLINKTRGFGFRNILGTQELADMTIDGNDQLMKQILANTNVKICLRQDVTSSQEELSNSLSTKDIYKPTISTSTSTNSDDVNRSQSISLEEELIYKPRDFGRLNIGEAIVFTKVPEFRYGKIKVRMVK